MDGLIVGVALSIVGVVGAAWAARRERSGRSLFGGPAPARPPARFGAVAAAAAVWVAANILVGQFGWKGAPLVLASSLGSVAAAAMILGRVAPRGRIGGANSSLLRVALLGAASAIVILGLSQALQFGLSALYDAAGLALPTQSLVDMFRDGSIGERATLALTAALLAPFAEEIFFRGALLPALCAVMPVRTALFAQAVAFGLLHVLGREPHFMPLAIPLAVAGWAWGWLYLRTGSLRLVIVSHAVFNGIQVAFMVAA